jgi:preprotein translocase subunit SecD
MSLEFEQQVGPQLGADAIRWGATSFVIGAFLIVAFMIFYYRLAGTIAVAALVLNVLFILGILAAVEARLTLPGIAGIVLTIGMAVDANVIINERIREELRAGKSPRAAVDAGYARAFWTIFDSQVTTFIAAVVLYQFGTGPIRGFAVTLMIGIITSMFTGIFVTRLFFDYITHKKRPATLSV